MTALVNQDTGEIADSLDKATARDLLEGIKANLDDTAELVDQLWRGRGWVALGYGSWDALVTAEIRPGLPKLDRAERREAVAKLAGRGMSTRAIGSALGVGVGTVNRDLAGVPDGTPESDGAAASHTCRSCGIHSGRWPWTDSLCTACAEEPLPQPAKTIGLDGKQYSRRPKAAAVEPTPEEKAKSAERARQARVFQTAQSIYALLARLVEEGLEPDVLSVLNNLRTHIDQTMTQGESK